MGIIILIKNKTISFENDKVEKNLDFATEAKKAAPEACFLDLAKS